MTFDYKVLKVDRECDTSTNNLKRKYNKLVISYNKNPSQDKLTRINTLKGILFPTKPFIREKCFSKKKVDCNIMRFVRNDKNLARQLDGRAWTSYTLLSNIFPDEISKMILKLCGFTLKDYTLSIPKDVYLFARIYYKNMEEKERMIKLYKKNKQIKNLINNLHSKKNKK
jgi:hypothetical protein